MKNMRKVLIALLVVMTLLASMSTVTAFAAKTTGDTTIYLAPNANWKKDGARFALYTWDGGDKWFNLTDPDGDGIYECVIPAGIENIIFCRMNPGATANNWNNKWNQTANLKYNGSNNLYTVKEGTWDKGGGNWSTFNSSCAHVGGAPATCTTDQVCTKCGDVIVSATGHSYNASHKCTKCSVQATFTVAGADSSNSASIFGTAWDTTNTANDMTHDAATGVYTKVYENVPAGTYKFKCARDYDWGTAYPSSDKSVSVSKSGSILTITLNGTTVTTKVEAPVAKIGAVNYMDLQSAIDAAVDGDTVTLLAGTYTANLSVNKAITVVGETTSAGTKSVTIKGKLSVTANGATVKNINFDNGSSTAGYVSGSDILIEGCTVKGGNGFRYCYTNGVVTFKNSVITGSTYGIHFDGNAGGEIVIDGCTITGWTSFAGTINKVSMVDTSFEKGNYNYIRFYQKEVVLDGCTFNESMQVDLAVSEANVTVDNCVVENGGEAAKLFSNGDIVASNIVVDETKLLPLYAQINGVDYRGSYNDVFNAAVDGDEVTIVAKGTYKLLVSGKSITVTAEVDGVIFEGMGAYNMGSANVTFNNVTFNWKNENYKGLQHAGNIVYNNCTINGQVFLYGNSDIFNECTFNQTSANAYNVWTYASKYVEFNKCTFNCAGKAVLVYAEKSTIFNTVKITETTFNASAPAAGKAAIEIDTSLTAGANIAIDGATVANGFDAGNVSGNRLWNNKKGNAEDKNNDIVVSVDGETVLEPLPYYVTIGTTQYTSLQAAVNKAKNGDVIVLSDNIILTETLVVDGKTLTLDLNGKTLSFAGVATFSARNANVLISAIGGANVTIDGEGLVLANGAIFSTDDDSEIVIVTGTFDADFSDYLANGLRVLEVPQADGTVLYGVVSHSEVPFIGENGNWWVGKYDTGVIAQPKVEIVEVDGVRYWFINGVNTGYIADPTNAITPEIKIIDGVWYVDLKDGNGFQSTAVVAEGVDGIGIDKIVKVETVDNVDRYEITYTDGTVSSFFVANGNNGSQGPAGNTGLQGLPGAKGDRGEAGLNGLDNTWLVNNALIVSLVCVLLTVGVVLILNNKRLNWWSK